MENFETDDFNPRSAKHSHKNLHESLVDPNKRLLTGEQTYGMREFFDEVLDSRVIAISTESSQVSIYERLMLHGLPLFSGSYKGNELVLTVPTGRTRLLSQELRFLARDITNYSEIFTEFGETLHDIDRAGYGLPESKYERSLMSNFAFSADSSDSDDLGVGNIYLIPPFSLNKDVNINQEFNFVRQELENSELFKPDEVEKLMVRLNDGFNNGRNT